MQAAWPWGQPIDGIVQTGLVSDDIDADMRRYATTLGTGPWFVRRDFGFDRRLYRGEASAIAMDLAIAFSGTMMIELIQQKCDTPGTYREARGGLHHYAMAARPERFDARLAGLAAQGFPLLYDLDVSAGGRTASFDARPACGAVIELIEVVPEVEALFTAMWQASRDWDGSDPVRSF